MIKTLTRNLNLLKALIFILAGVLPISLLLFGLPGQQLSPVNIVHILARMFAITGILTFSSNLLLAGRYGFLDKFVGGLEKLFNLHRLTGKVAYLLITLHITLISSYYFLLSQEVFMSFILQTDLPIVLGKTAFTIFTVIIFITLYLKIRYEYKQFIHRFMGIVLLIGLLHGLNMMSDLEFNQTLRYYVIGFVGVALTSYLFRNILRGFVVKHYAYEVVSNELINNNIYEIHMKSTGKNKITFNPGQFVFVNFKQKGFTDERHPFSITSSVNDEYISINPKDSGDFTSKLDLLNIGAKCIIEGPYGGFNYLNAMNTNQIWIAGGIGITPFIAMYKHLKENDSNINVTLIHSVGGDDDAIKSNEFKTLESQTSDFKYVVWNTKENGHLDYQKLTSVVDPLNKSILICGPEPMVNSLRKEFKQNKVDSLNVQYELFKMF